MQNREDRTPWGAALMLLLVLASIIFALWGASHRPMPTGGEMPPAPLFNR